jgi:hypothetical protein
MLGRMKSLVQATAVLALSSSIPAATLTGCLEAPRPFPTPDVSDTTDGPSAPRLFIQDVGNDVVVEAVGIRVGFLASRGWAPGSIEVPAAVGGGGGWRQILYTDDGIGDGEHGLGVLRYDTTRAVGVNDSEEGGRNFPSGTEVRGSVVYQLSRSWTAIPGELSGTSTYTVHLDGRLHVHHAVQSGAAPPADAYQTAFLALHKDLFGVLRENGDGESHTPTPFSPVTTPGGHDYEEVFRGRLATTSEWTCVYTTGASTFQVALGLAALPVTGALGMRATEGWSDEVMSSIRLQADWMRPGESGLDGATEAAFLIATQQQQGCTGALAKRVAQFRFPPHMEATFGQLDLEDPYDAGGDDGYLEGVGVYGIVANPGANSVRFRFQERGPPPTVRISKIDGLEAEADTSVTVSIDGRDTPRFLVQTDPARRHLYVAFLAEPPADTEITINW